VAHNALKITVGRAQHELVVIAHQTVGMPFGIVAIGGVCEQGDEVVPVIICFVDPTPPQAPGYSIRSARAIR
jgi:hypothetical protein